MIEAVYLDRDGTINRDVHYLSTPEAFELLPGVGEGFRMMSDMKLPLFVVTNQSGVARGYFTESDLEAIHGRMISELDRFGVSFAGIYYCPHGPDDECTCRKPKPGMIEQARRENGGLTGVMIGDSPRDVECGRRAGQKTILIGDKQTCETGIDYVAADLIAAAHWIARQNEVAL